MSEAVFNFNLQVPNNQKMLSLVDRGAGLRSPPCETGGRVPWGQEAEGLCHLSFPGCWLTAVEQNPLSELRQ